MSHQPPVALSRSQARRVTLAAQGFIDPPHSPPTMRTLSRTVGRTGLLQVDSVNVLVRAHQMPLYSRMGPYDQGLLDRAASGREQRRLVEYWAHVQAFMPVDLWPSFAHRRAEYRARRGKWARIDEGDPVEHRLLAELGDRGPSTARELEHLAAAGARTKEHWGWNWSQARRVLDYLYSAGEVAIAGRTSSFEVRYGLPEDVLPRAVLETPTPSVPDQHLTLVRRAARSHGVATLRCLADYHRMRIEQVRPAVETMVEAGELQPARVEGWDRPAYLSTEARRPRRVAARALLSPFDPVVWERERTERLFGFRYRIEIYTPAHRRVHGYYVLPFLLGEDLVARVDLKADRATGRLLVQGAFAEPGAPVDTEAELAAELRRMADWLGLDDVVVAPNGDLAPGLSIEVARV